MHTFGTIDILVNNAAFQRTYEKLENISDDEFEETPMPRPKRPFWTTLMRIVKTGFPPLQWHHAIKIFSRVKALSTAKERPLHAP